MIERPTILGVDYAKEGGEYNAECEGYYNNNGVLQITNIYRWNQTIEHEATND